MRGLGARQQETVWFSQWVCGPCDAILRANLPNLSQGLPQGLPQVLKDAPL